MTDGIHCTSRAPDDTGEYSVYSSGASPTQSPEVYSSVRALATVSLPSPRPAWSLSAINAPYTELPRAGREPSQRHYLRIGH